MNEKQQSTTGLNAMSGVAQELHKAAEMYSQAEVQEIIYAIAWVDPEDGALKLSIGAGGETSQAARQYMASELSGAFQ